ncbi:junctophilin-1-like [Centruroides vittatus]|uniref:junctophilin-1-like n=1 Tax=Centruroides vittatus TaxID=120091 RepID=UPI003510A541
MSTPQYQPKTTSGGRFDFDDGGTYCGGWEDGKAHGHGVCTGPKGQGEYCGSWHYGFEVSGVYTWPTNSTYEGQWQNGKRHGLGVETRGRWIYRGEWTQGLKGRYGGRQSVTSGAKYEGTWANGLQDGYGSETYADGGTYQGQWMRGMRHGYGVRSSAPFGLASHYHPKTVRESFTSLEDELDSSPDRKNIPEEGRGGFVLKARSDEPTQRRRHASENVKRSIFQGLRKKKSDSSKQDAVGPHRSTNSMSSASSESGKSGYTHTSMMTDSNTSFVSQDDITDANVIETYMGDWKNDKRSGFGIAERSDGLKYEGEWYNNKKYGYGVTTLKDGKREEGKYKNNVLVTSGKKKHLFLLRSARFRERVQSAVNAAIQSSQIALQKADIAISRTATARGKAEQADIAAIHAKEDAEIARLVAKQFAPDFNQPGAEHLKHRLGSKLDSQLNLLRLPPRDNFPSQHRSRSLYLQATTVSKENLASPSDFDQPSNEQDEHRGYTIHHTTRDHFDHYQSVPLKKKAAPKSLQTPRTETEVSTLADTLKQYYGADCTPDSGVSESMDNDEAPPVRPPRRSTLPSVLYPPECPPVNIGVSDSEAGSNTPEDEGASKKRAFQEGPQRTSSCLFRRHAPLQQNSIHMNEHGRRKKSLPDIGVLAVKSPGMSREEVAALSSLRRAELIRQEEEAERLRSNPLLYLLSPDVRDWLSRQQLVMLVLFINISLAIMFFKLLT